ncbi:MAG: hypothetical protein ABL876_09650 [Chitinophagaceae bacterium]
MKHFIHLSTISTRSFLVILLLAITAATHAQVPRKEGRCKATADQIYFVASGQMVIDVSPGSNGGNGYQLNILGVGADNFEVVQEPYMTTLNVIPGYTNATAAKWQVFFAAGMERVICSIKMKNKCTGETLTYPLTVGVRLLNQ